MKRKKKVCTGFSSGHSSFELTWRDDLFTPSQLQAQIWNQTDPAMLLGFGGQQGATLVDPTRQQDQKTLGMAQLPNSIALGLAAKPSAFSTKNIKATPPVALFD